MVNDYLKHSLNTTKEKAQGLLSRGDWLLAVA